MLAYCLMHFGAFAVARDDQRRAEPRVRWLTCLLWLRALSEQPGDGLSQGQSNTLLSGPSSRTSARYHAEPLHAADPCGLAEPGGPSAISTLTSRLMQAWGLTSADLGVCGHEYRRSLQQP